LRTFTIVSAQAADAASARAKRLRRLVSQAVISAAVICLIAALISGWQYYRAETARGAEAIQAKIAGEQRDQALLNVSRFLTTKAEDALAASDPQLASLIARAALPADLTKPDRLVWSPALFALTQARDVDFERVIMVGHVEQVLSAAWSPDGTRIVTPPTTIPRGCGTPRLERSLRCSRGIRRTSIALHGARTGRASSRHLAIIRCAYEYRRPTPARCRRPTR
jgi:hypothetical protein